MISRLFLGRLTWSSLHRLGESRVLKSSYIWLLVVPVTARLTSKVDEFTTFVFGGTNITLHLSLPFSWKIFYLAAASVAIASLLYTLLCPPIVHEYQTFTDFRMSGRDSGYLKRTASRLHLGLEYMWSSEDELDPTRRHKVGNADEEVVAYRFWKVRDMANICHLGGIALTASFYAIGLLLFGYVLVQNFIFVFRLIF